MTVNIFDDLINSVIDCFNRAFDFETRSTRKEFWYWQVFRILMFLSFSYIESIGITGILILSNLIFLIPELSVSIRRLHDINKSGLWILLSITIIGIIPQIFLMVSIGSGLEKIIKQNLEAPRARDLIFSPDIYFPLIGFFLLIILTIILRKFFYKK